MSTTGLPSVREWNEARPPGAKQIQAAYLLAERIKATLPASFHPRLMTDSYHPVWDDADQALAGGEYFLKRYETLMNEPNKDKWVSDSHARVWECLESAEDFLVEIYRVCRNVQWRQHPSYIKTRGHLVLLRGGRRQDPLSPLPPIPPNGEPVRSPLLPSN